MRVLICGGRDLNLILALTLIKIALTNNKISPTLIIAGGAEGADKAAEIYANHANIECNIYPANWKKYKNAAGPIRNRQMLFEGKPDIVIALPGGRGTKNMITQAEDNGVDVIQVETSYEVVMKGENDYRIFDNKIGKFIEIIDFKNSETPIKSFETQMEAFEKLSQILFRENNR